MNLNIGPRGILVIDDARIVYRNFSGAASQYNREGDRNFAVVIPDEETCERLKTEGWNVRIKPPRTEDDEPFRYLTVKVKFNDNGPNVFLQSGQAKNRLDEEDISILDNIDIDSVSLDVRPYDWEANGKSGRAAYLQGMWVTQRVDRFVERYAEAEGM